MWCPGSFGKGLIQNHLPDDHDALFISSMFDEVGLEKISKGHTENVK